MEDFEKDAMRGSETQMRQALENMGVQFRGRACKCPFCDDQHPSAGIYFKKGVWKFKCHGKCKIDEDVIGVIAKGKGMKPGDVLKENTQTNGHHRPASGSTEQQVFPSLDAIRDSFRATDVFPYTDPETKIADLVVLRRDEIDGKRISQCHRVGDGYAYGAPTKPDRGYPIFNRARVALADTVFVVEGEKKVKILTKLGFVATSSPMGAGKYANADWSPLNAKKCVILWPDHDAPDESGKRVGHEHMRGVSEILMRLNEPPEIRWVDPEFFEIPPKGDVEQYLEMFGGDTDESRKSAIRLVIDSSIAMNGSAGLSETIEDTINGRRSVIPLPWYALDHLSQALMPGTVTCICGDPGCSKSLMLIQAGLYWHKNNVRVAIYMLEEEKSYHLQRAMAILEGKSDLTDLRWMKANPIETRQAYTNHKATLDSFARCIYDAPDDVVSLDQLAKWVEERAVDGYQIIAIDPITAADSGDKRYVSDYAFMMKVKSTARRFGCRVILTTHPRNDAKGWLDMAGGSSFPRFSQTVAWIHAHEPPKKIECSVYQGATEFGRSEFEVNRTIKLGKTRNGRGAGAVIGFEFEKKTLRFVERGVQVKVKKEKHHDDE